MSTQAMKTRRVIQIEKSLGKLPEEMLEEILSRLPVKSLVKMKAVSKSWHALISNSYFLNLHLKRSIDQNRTWLMFLHDYCYPNLAYEPSQKPIQVGESNGVEVLASCNGLFYISNNQNDFFLWNPSIREARKIPTSTIEFPLLSTWASVFFGLGYHSKVDDYRLVRVSMFDGMDFQTEVKIYSRNSDAWRKMGDFPYDFPFARPGLFLCGCLHWIVYMFENNVYSHKVAALNVSEETYELIQLPKFGSELALQFDMGSLEENLVVFYPDIDESYNVWILKEYGKVDSWTRIKIAADWTNGIDAFLYFEPLCVVKPGEILFRIGAKKCVSFNVKEKRCFDVFVPYMSESRIVSFVESLVSPNYR